MSMSRGDWAGNAGTVQARETEVGERVMESEGQFDVREYGTEVIYSSSKEDADFRYDKDTLGSDGNRRDAARDRSERGVGRQSAGVRAGSNPECQEPNPTRKPPWCCWGLEATVTHYRYLKWKLLQISPLNNYFWGVMLQTQNCAIFAPCAHLID